MIRAFLYLQFTQFRGGVKQRLLRLRQPKYLFGALFGAAYFYLFFFRHLIHGPRGSGRGFQTTVPAIEPLLEPLAATLLVIGAVLAWMLPARRAALQFTEAEVAFLFPAPVSRRTLIHFKLLKSQFAILISALFFTLISHRVAWLGGNAVMHAMGWWLALSAINLYLLGASFGRERLLQRGVTARQRFLIGATLAVITVGAVFFWLRAVLPPFPTELDSLAAWRDYASTVFASTPMRVVLFAPLLVLRPFFASDVATFAWVIGPALASLGVLYWWVVRSDVSFEEESLTRARKQAETAAAVRSGDWQAARNIPMKSRTAAFTLKPQGSVAVAFLWKNLIALGPLHRLRVWLIAAGVVVVLHIGAALIHVDRAVYAVTTIVPLTIGGWLLIVGPMIMRRDLRLLVTHFDLLKGYPLRGWQVVLGSLLPSIVVLAAWEWLLLLIAAPGLGIATRSPTLAAGVISTGALGIALVLPPLAALMLCIPFGATLFFPAWTDSSASAVGPGGGGGIEAMGQRLIFFFGYLLVLMVTLIPAGLCAGVTAVIANWLGGPMVAIIATTLAASVVITAECVAVIWWLGQRFEHFDLSVEVPR